MQPLIVAHSCRYAKTHQAVQVCLLVLLLAACAQPSVIPTNEIDQPAPTVQEAIASPETPVASEPVMHNTEQTLIHLVEAERLAASTGNLAELAHLWAEEAVVIDGGGDSNPANDYYWRGRSAILDRYIVAVFSNPPPMRQEAARLQIEVTGDFATAIDLDNADQWKFHHQNGQWRLLGLAYAIISN